MVPWAETNFKVGSNGYKEMKEILQEHGLVIKEKENERIWILRI
jgi:CRISPR/Cas system Type II protein with McrA/HNH and RuvC-like nuclease domain